MHDFTPDEVEKIVDYADYHRGMFEENLTNYSVDERGGQLYVTLEYRTDVVLHKDEVARLLGKEG